MDNIYSENNWKYKTVTLQFKYLVNLLYKLTKYVKYRWKLLLKYCEIQAEYTIKIQWNMVDNIYRDCSEDIRQLPCIHLFSQLVIQVD